MPKPMKVKMFMGQKASEVEKQINGWLDDFGSAIIVTSQTVVTAIAEKSEGATCPCIVVTVWYEPPEAS